MMKKDEVYQLCEECTHTLLIHSEDGCRAYKCHCPKKPQPNITTKGKQ